mmetsp:Transcript_7138/g.15601  ORF Transcript_7138/g.15601 Transcript_7138/m.15601 type:complete len:223 (+) Transcript_7138:756-1424(+)
MQSGGSIKTVPPTGVPRQPPRRRTLPGGSSTTTRFCVSSSRRQSRTGRPRSTPSSAHKERRRRRALLRRGIRTTSRIRSGRATRATWSPRALALAHRQGSTTARRPPRKKSPIGTATTKQTLMATRRTFLRGATVFPTVLVLAIPPAVVRLTPARGPTETGASPRPPPPLGTASIRTARAEPKTTLLPTISGAGSSPLPTVSPSRTACAACSSARMLRSWSG